MTPWALTPSFPVGNAYWSTSGFKSPGWFPHEGGSPNSMQAGISDLGTSSSPAVSSLKTEGYFKTGEVRFIWYGDTPFIQNSVAEFWVSKKSGNSLISNKILAIGGYSSFSFTYEADPIMYQPGFSYASGNGPFSQSLWNINTGLQGQVIYSITGSGFYNFEWRYVKRNAAGYNDPSFFGNDTVRLYSVSLPEYYTLSLDQDTNIYDNFISSEIFSSGQIFLSLDSGKSFKKVGPDKKFTSVNASNHKSILLATTENDFVYISKNTGETWLPTLFESNWKSSALSFNGEYIIVGGSDGLYYSIDYGENWELVLSYNITDVDINEEGSQQIAVTDEGDIFVSLNYSNDFGIPDESPNKNWSSIAIMENDGIVVATTHDEYIYISLDFGLSWNSVLNDRPRNWSSVGIRNDGRILATEMGGNIFYSENVGSTWSEINLPNNWQSVSMADISINTLTGAVLLTSSMSRTYTGAFRFGLNNLQENFYEGYWTDGFVSADGQLQLICRQALNDLRIKYTNLYDGSFMNKFSTNTIYGYGDINVSATGEAIGLITQITGESLQDAVLLKTGLLQNTILPEDFGIATWQLNLEETGSPGNVFLNYVSSTIPAINQIEFLNSTGSGLFNGDSITITNAYNQSINFIYDNEIVDNNIFSGLDDLVDKINLLNYTPYEDTFLDQTFVSYRDNNIIYIIDDSNIGESGNLAKIFRFVENPNAIKIPNRYFQNGSSNRPLVNNWTGIFSFSGDIVAENSGFYTQNVEEEFENEVSGILWQNSLLSWSVSTGLRRQNELLTNTQNLEYNIIYSGYSGNLFLPISQRTDFISGFNFIVSRNNPDINNYKGVLLYKLKITNNENSINLYSGLLTG